MDLLRMSLSGGVLILFTLLLRAAALHRLPKATFLALWAVALCRLLLPLSLSSPWSVYGLLPAASAAPSAAAIESSGGLSPALLVWLTGAAAIALFFAVTYGHSRRTLRCALPVEDCAVVEAWQVSHKVAVLRSDRLSTPIAAGLFRPRVILPAAMDFTDGDLLLHVLTHEYVHIRRLDALWRLLLASAACLHWFNPLVWAMFALAPRDLELTCDAHTVRLLGPRARTAYATSLLNMAHPGGATPLSNAFGQTPTEERIVSIMNLQKRSLIGIAVALLLILGAAVCLATTPADPAAAEPPALTPAGEVTPIFTATGTAEEAPVTFTTVGSIDLEEVTIVDSAQLIPIESEEYTVLIATAEDGTVLTWGAIAEPDEPPVLVVTSETP